MIPQCFDRAALFVSRKLMDKSCLTVMLLMRDEEGFTARSIRCEAIRPLAQMAVRFHR